MRTPRQPLWNILVWGLIGGVVLAALARGIVALAGQPAATAPGTTVSAVSPVSPGDWTQSRYDVFGTGTNPTARITTANAGQLTPLWTYHSPVGPFSSTPAIAGDTLYTTTGKFLYAFDLRTGTPRWRFEVLKNPYGALLTSSVAVDPTTHMAYFGTPDARVYGVDTQTGKGVWNIQLGDPVQGAFIWGSPLLVNRKLYIGLASREDNPCVRSAVFALDPATGAIEWTHWTAPEGTLGGGIWSSMSADPAKHALLVTTSNACPFGPVAGDEDAILALDWDTGATQWRYTAIHRDDDFDFGQGAVSFTYGGVPYVVAGNKYGVVYSVVPPAAPGGQPRLAWATRITGAGYLSFSGIYQPPAYLNGVIYVAGGPTLDNACPKGAIWALDARSGAPRWRQCTASQVVSPGAISGNVLFIADNNGIYGFDVNTGRKVWSAPLTGPLWGGIAIVGGMVVVGTVPGDLHAYSLPAA